MNNNFSIKSLLIIGADHLGNIATQLKNLGINKIFHITGRKCQEVKKGIPENVDAVLVLTDYVNHNLSIVIKQKAKEQALPIFFARRSWCSIYQVLSKV